MGGRFQLTRLWVELRRLARIDLARSPAGLLVLTYPSSLQLVAEREKAAMALFPGPEIVASRIDAIVNFDRTAEIASIKTPTLVICAKDDFLTPPYFSQELARLIPRAKLVLLERGGHCASETSLPEFNEAVLGFIDQHS